MDSHVVISLCFIAALLLIYDSDDVSAHVFCTAHVFFFFFLLAAQPARVWSVCAAQANVGQV